MESSTVLIISVAISAISISYVILTGSLSNGFGTELGILASLTLLAVAVLELIRLRNRPPRDARVYPIICLSATVASIALFLSGTLDDVIIRLIVIVAIATYGIGRVSIERTAWPGWRFS